MRLKVENIARVKTADIQIDGITVIAGKNNTGKSTIGKTLFAVFYSCYEIETKVKRSKEAQIRNLCYSMLRDRQYQEHRRSERENMHEGRSVLASKYITKEILENAVSIDVEKIEQILSTNLKRYGLLSDIKALDLTFVRDLAEHLAAKMNIPEEGAFREAIERHFLRVFNGQVNHSAKPEDSARISLEIKGQSSDIEFQNNQCVEWQRKYDIMHQAFYIDDPFIMDEINTGGISRFGSEMQRHLVSHLHAEDSDIMENIFDAVDNKERLKSVYQLLSTAMPGKIVERNGEYWFSDSEENSFVAVKNLSTGLKSFAIIQMLLERGILKEKDVLILDEPEVHLHPEWLLIYAELIVLLQKEFDINMLVTTHSSEFLDAVEYFSKRYGIDQKCHYYLAGNSAGGNTFDDVTECTEKIYKQMVTPSMLLDKLKYELDQGEDE